MLEEDVVINPYIVESPVTDTKMIFGRNGVFRWLISNLGSESSGRPLVICSGQGCGKSTVIYQISNGILGGSYPVIDIDAVQIAGDSVTDFFWRLTTTTRQSFAKLNLSTPGLEKQMLILGPERAFSRDFWEPLLLEHSNRQFILAIDNFEKLIGDLRGNDDIARKRRNLWRLTIDNQNVTLILCLAGRLELYSEESFAPFDLSLVYQLRKLKRPETHELLNIPDWYYVPQHVSEYVHQLTGGHPADIQRIGKGLFERAKQLGIHRIALADVLVVLSGKNQPSDFYSSVYSKREKLAVIYSQDSQRFRFVSDS